MRRAALGFAVLVWAAAALGQASPAEGKWWKRPRIAQELQLSAGQTAALEKIFAKSSVKPAI